MSNTTAELNLKQAVDNDDTADYLTIGLASSLATLDGLFNSTTGHTHNGAHQGGVLQFQDMLVGGNLTVNGTSLLKGAVQTNAGLAVGTVLSSGGLATLNSLDVTTTSRLRGAVTIDGTINSSAGLTIGQDLSVGRDLSVARNATITGVLTVGSINGTSGLTITGNATISGVLSATRVTLGVDYGHTLNVLGNGIASGSFYNRAGTARCYDTVDFSYGVPAAANTLVQRDASGYITASYINYAGDVQGGKPTHVLGHTAGDNYLRWWPANAIGPPIGTWVWSGTCDSGGADIGLSGRNLNVAETSDPQSLASASGTTITVAKAGYYHLYAMAQTNSQVFVDSRTWRLQFYVNGAAQANKAASDTTPVNGNQGGGVSRTHAVAGPVFINAGQTVQVFGIHNASGWPVIATAGGYVEMVFIPTADYNN